MRNQLALAVLGWELLVAPHSPVQGDRIHVTHRRADAGGAVRRELVQPAPGPQASSGQSVQSVERSFTEQASLDRMLHQQDAAGPAAGHRGVVEDRSLTLRSRSQPRSRRIDCQPAQSTPLAVQHTGPAFGLWRFHAGPRSLSHKVLTTPQTAQ